MFDLSFEVEELPKLPNQVLGAHWRVRSSHAKKWKRLVSFQIIDSIPEKPLQKASIVCTRFSSRKPDYDGLAGSFKSVIDALVHFKVIEDDTPDVIGHPDYKWEKCPPRKGKIRVIIKGEQ